MSGEASVSVVIPTWNRRELLSRALDSVMEQTLPVSEIIVVDDGSTDGTARMLQERGDPRIRCLRQANSGVSAARNAGLALARGEFIALLDSDDLWHADKTRLQVEWLQARPEFGMVLCDVQRVHAHDPGLVDVFRRREVIPRDGWVLEDVLRNPSLVPASAMFRRRVYEDVGGFDASLRTAEDLDFHLRVAARWPIGKVEQVLVQAMRGHDGLSAEAGTYDDYVQVIEQALADSPGVAAPVRRAALLDAYWRNARGKMLLGSWRDAARLWRLGWANAGTGPQRRRMLALLPFALRRWLLLRLRRAGAVPGPAA